jgi:hypothetical protein
MKLKPFIRSVTIWRNSFDAVIMGRQTMTTLSVINIQWRAKFSDESNTRKLYFCALDCFCTYEEIFFENEVLEHNGSVSCRNGLSAAKRNRN